MTIADTEGERAIVAVLKKKFPEHGFIGEEGTQKKGDYTWIIDSVDGTYNFERGIPDWCVLVALLHKDTVVAGVYWAPVHKVLIHAEKGAGCFINGTRAVVSETSELSKAYIAFNMIDKFERAGLEKQLFKLARTKTLRNMDKWLSFPYFLQGKIDARIHGPPHFWDIAPFIVMTEEAGGVVADFNGKPATKDSKTFIFTNKQLLPTLVEYLHE